MFLYYESKDAKSVKFFLSLLIHFIQITKLLSLSFFQGLECGRLKIKCSGLVLIDWFLQENLLCWIEQQVFEVKVLIETHWEFDWSIPIFRLFFAAAQLGYFLRSLQTSVPTRVPIIFLNDLVDLCFIVMSDCINEAINLTPKKLLPYW